MSSLNHALEWDRFLDLAADQARTEPGQELILQLEEPDFWAGDVAHANFLQSETREALALLDRDALWGPLFELKDPFELLDRLSRSAILELSDLAELRRWLVAGDSWSQVPREEIGGELFRKAITALPDSATPLRVIDKVVTPEGEMNENATPKLAVIYSEIRSLKREISLVLDQMVKTYAQKGVLQENFTDVRDGRYVIPIKISNQNDVDGIIYEASASRQTVFVEPKEVSPLNNRLRQRQNDLMQEIIAILEDTSKKLRPHAAEMVRMCGIVAHWDAVHARARIGRVFGGRPIEVTEERVFDLHQTANPLLWWAIAPEKVIRNDVVFGEPSLTLLLTGPNTGGKTVLLKTLGFAAAAARTGFPLPAGGAPKVPFFDSVFADLGDPQSIEQHLSSFSGHIARFKNMLDQLTEKSLVLLDELNSATDPEEGAALGRAFLETLMRRKSMIVATTHDPRLKLLAQSDPRVLNASMAFDENAKSPTFRIQVGVPGRSRALDTARRLGLDEDVVKLAESYLTEDHKRLEELLGKLENDARTATRLKQEAQTAHEEADRMKREWQSRLDQSLSELISRTRQRLRRVLDQAQDEVRERVRRLEETRNRKEVDQARSSLNEAFSDAMKGIDQALEAEAPDVARALKDRAKIAIEEEAPKAPSLLAVGSSVKVPKWKSIGTVVAVQGTQVKVALGAIQMTMPLSDIEPISNKEAQKLAPRPKRSSFAEVAAPPAEIDLRGKRYDEAMSELESYVDQAFRSGAHSQITIVHGLGTGAIREGTRQLLSKLPYVKNFQDGGVGRGGTGSTVVEFDR